MRSCFISNEKVSEFLLLIIRFLFVPKFEVMIIGVS